MRRRDPGRRRLVLLLLAATALWAGSPGASQSGTTGPYLVVLGVAQDGGYPQAGCRRACCKRAWSDPRRRRAIASLGIVDPASGERWIVDATPDFRDQLRRLDEIAPAPETAGPGLAGILLTHGHVGHYAGLIHLGREAMGTRAVPLHVMPRMKKYLSSSGPWDQLVRLGNVMLRPMWDGTAIRLNARLGVTPFLVPHRDEYTETVGFKITGPRNSFLYLPDIDKWEKWRTPIEEMLAGVDAAYLDGTFYAAGEIPGRDMSEIPHPFIVETMKRLAALPASERVKVRFIHLNHTNPALDPTGPAARAIRRAGFNLAVQGERRGL